MDLDFGFNIQNLDLPGTRSGSVLLAEFSLVQPEEAGGLVGEVRLTTSMLNPWPSWLVNATRGSLQHWLAPLLIPPGG